MVFDLRDIKIASNQELYVTENGFIYPDVLAVDFNWGETSFYHENFIMQVLVDGWIKFLLVIIQNSLYFLGNEILNGMIEPIVTKILMYYQIPI